MKSLACALLHTAVTGVGLLQVSVQLWLVPLRTLIAKLSLKTCKNRPSCITMLMTVLSMLCIGSCCRVPSFQKIISCKSIVGKSCCQLIRNHVDHMTCRIMMHVGVNTQTNNTDSIELCLQKVQAMQSRLKLGNLQLVSGTWTLSTASHSAHPSWVSSKCALSSHGLNPD